MPAGCTFACQLVDVWLKSQKDILLRKTWKVYMLFQLWNAIVTILFCYSFTKRLDESYLGYEILACYEERVCQCKTH